MGMRSALIVLAAGGALGALAGCSGGGAAARSPSPGSSAPALTFSAAPVKFRVVTCGKLTPAEQHAVHTRAGYGVVIRATNTGSQAVMPTCPRSRWNSSGAAKPKQTA